MQSKVRVLRKQHKLSQEELALAVGVTRQTITSIENEKYTASLILAYKIGQKYYPIPYAWKKLTAYIVIALLVFLINHFIISFINNFWIKTVVASFFMLGFLLFVINIEKKEIKKFPFIGKFIK